MTTTLFINDAGEISGADNFAADGDAPPATLPFEPSAPAPYAETLYLRGDINGWQAVNALSYLGNHTYELCRELQAGDIEFKFADANWTPSTNFGAPFFDTGLNVGEASGNLRATVPTSGAYCFNFFSYAGTGENRFEFYRLTLGN